MVFGDFPGGPVAETPHSQCRGLGSIPGRGTRSHMLQLKIQHATTKTWCSQIYIYVCGCGCVSTHLYLTVFCSYFNILSMKCQALTKSSSGSVPCIFFNFCFYMIVQLSHVRLFVTPWSAARQASLSITNSWSPLKLMSIKSVMPFNHLILCCPLLLLPSIFPSIKVFSNELVLRIR